MKGRYRRKVLNNNILKIYRHLFCTIPKISMPLFTSVVGELPRYSPTICAFLKPSTNASWADKKMVLTTFFVLPLLQLFKQIIYEMAATNCGGIQPFRISQVAPVKPDGAEFAIH